MSKALSLVFLFLAGISGAQAGELKVRVNSDPPTLDWNLATDLVSANVIENFMEGLASFDDRMKPAPGLAESWKISRDGKTYTYKLRKGVVWTDGVPLNAQQFVDSWLRLLDPKTASEYAYFLFDLQGAKEFNEGKADASAVGVKALSPDTLEVKLKHPASYFAAIPTATMTYPIRKDVIEKYGVAWTKPENIRTLGPFELKSWAHDSKITLETNPRYYGKKPKVSKVTGYIVSEDSTAVTMFEAGNLDFMGRIPPLDLPRWEKNAAFRGIPSYEVVGFQFNVSKPPFDNPKVRQAFSLAIDREQVAKLVGGGRTATASWIPPGLLGHDSSLGFKFDPKRARALLAEAGYADGKGFPKVTAFFPSSDLFRLLGERLQAAWREQLGVEISLQHEDWKSYLQHLSADAPPIFHLRWVADIPDPDNFMNLFTSGSGNNNSRWKNAEYDRLVAKASAEKTDAKRVSLYREAQKLMLEKEAVLMPIMVEGQRVLISPKVSGLKILPNYSFKLKDADIR